MKLYELFTDPTSINPMQSHSAVDLNNTPMAIGILYNREKHKRSSSSKKARAIRAFAKERKHNYAKDTDTPHKYNIGGHVSSFLFR